MVPFKLSGRWSPGRQQLPREVVDRYKSERVMRALAAVTSEVGTSRLTVGQVTGRGKIARTTFYELFDNRDDALLGAVELAGGKLRAAIDKAADHEESWGDRIARVIRALLHAAAEEPDLTALSLLHYGGAPGARSPVDPKVVDCLAGVLRPGRKVTHALLPGPRTEDLVAYGILRVIAERLRRGEPEALEAQAAGLTELALRPFLRQPDRQCSRP